MDIERLRTIVGTVDCEENFSFAKHTTYGCGGTAAKAYFPKNIRQAVCVYKYLKASGEKFVTLGNGSNVLASDKPFDGSVICTRKMKGMYLTGEDTAFCFAGTNVGEMLKFCVDNNLSGLEYLAGIPATCGGLAFMNGGAAGRYVCGEILKVKFFDGKLRDISNKSCNFGNKYSIMRDINGLILGTEFKLKPQDKETVRKNIQTRLKNRSALPKGKSCGCVFKNPDGVSAGKIIDDAGLKGLSLGGAVVSGEHGNFIINTGNSSSDVYALIKEVKRKVFEADGINLEEEVIYIGDF